MCFDPASDGDSHAVVADEVIVAKGATGDSTQAQALRAAGLPFMKSVTAAGLVTLKGHALSNGGS